jgi:hypothetical protein
MSTRRFFILPAILFLMAMTCRSEVLWAAPSRAVSDWKLPLPVGEYEVTQGDQDSCYDTHCRGYAYGNQTTYCAIDLWVPNIAGMPVLAPADGIVIDVGYQPVGGGNYVYILHDDGLVSHYQHLQKVYVKTNDRLEQGKPFARVGATGSSDRRAWQEHLHFTALTDRRGTCVKFESLDGNTNFKTGATVRSSNVQKGTLPDDLPVPITPAPTIPPPPPPPPAPRPDKPTLSSPTNGARLSHNTDVTLTWNAVTNATQYKVELWGGPYSTMTPCDWQSDTTCHIGTMWPGTMQWHVKARNASRQESDWSDTWSFTIEGTPTPTWTRTPTRTPTPTYTPAPAPPVPSARDLQVIGTLTLSTTSPQVDQSVTAVLKFRNVSNRVVTIERLVVGARGPGARTAPNDGWGAREVDFPARTNLVLRPGEEYEYRDSRSFDQPGDYFAEPAYLDPALGKWEGIPPYPRVWFNVMPRPITTVAPPPPPPPSPGRLVLVEGLRISNTNPQVNQSVNARFRVRNDGGQPITARYLGVKGRYSSGATYDFHWIENLTLQPGQEYTYDVNRSFDRTGSYSLTPNWFDGTNWRDLTFANGSTSYVTINVASAPAPPTITPVPPSPGRVVLTQGLTISPSSPTRGQNVNARFVAKNIGGSPVTFRFFGVKGRHSSGAVYDFLWLENFTLQPGQEFTYDVNRTFDRTGSFTFTPNYSLNGSTWADLTFANGSTSYVTISVR